jgi:5'-nucleotidase
VSLSPVDLRQARVLLSNDDGIEAEGFELLEAAAGGFAREVWVSAPAVGHSGASSMVSLRREIEILPRGDRRFAVTGRPADSVLSALRVTMAESPPDLVLCGVNHGVNIGGDLIYSGTVGAAMVAALNGVPAIALSAAHAPGAPVAEGTWAAVRRALPNVVARLCRLGFPPKGAYCVNFPAEPVSDEPVVCAQSDATDTMVLMRLEGAETAEGTPRYTIRHTGAHEGTLEGTDLGAMRAGRIAVTPLTLDRTDRGLLRRIAETL